MVAMECSTFRELGDTVQTITTRAFPAKVGFKSRLPRKT